MQHPVTDMMLAMIWIDFVPLEIITRWMSKNYWFPILTREQRYGGVEESRVDLIDNDILQVLTYIITSGRIKDKDDADDLWM